jgi:hypothetical protein
MGRLEPFPTVTANDRLLRFPTSKVSAASDRNPRMRARKSIANLSVLVNSGL